MHVLVHINDVDTPLKLMVQDPASIHETLGCLPVAWITEKRASNHAPIRVQQQVNSGSPAAVSCCFNIGCSWSMYSFRGIGSNLLQLGRVILVTFMINPCSHVVRGRGREKGYGLLSTGRINPSLQIFDKIGGNSFNNLCFTQLETDFFFLQETMLIHKNQYFCYKLVPLVDKSINHHISYIL